jgi:biofilm PGA synthesis protein PgaD
METLIINKRRELPKAKRILWDIVTVALWLGFIYLWKPLLIVFYKIVTLEVPAEEISNWIYENVSSVTFEHAAYLLITTPIILFILSRLSRHKAPSEHIIYEAKDYAKYFNLDNTSLQECADAQLITVYFDEHGHIIRLSNQITQ